MIINMVGSSGGGFSVSNAILAITALAGSTVTITKSGTTKTVTADKSHITSLSSNDATYFFGIASGLFDSTAWTITATLNGTTQTASVVIDSNKFYDVSLTSEIPYGYRLLEYIQSTGTQYLDSGVRAVDIGKLDANMSFDTKCDPTGAYNILYGVSAYNSTDNVIYTTNGIALTAVAAYTNNSSVASFTGNTLIENIYIHSYFNFTGAPGAIINSTQYTYSGVNIKPSSTNTLYIFTMHYANGVNTSRIPTAKLYNFKVWDSSSNVIANLLPCYRISDGAKGVIDTVSKSFIGNSGTDTFVAGDFIT